MKRQHLFFLSLIAASLIASCTKDDEGTTNQSTIKPPVDNSEKVTGEFWSILTEDLDIPGSITENTMVYFVRSVQENMNVLADTVFINRFGMSEDLTDNFHYLSLTDEGPLTMKDSCTWEVIDTSHAEIPSFKYTLAAPYPSILGELPDTVVRAKGFQMNIKIAEADSIVLGIAGDTLNSDGFIYKTVSPALGIYGFSYDEIKSIRPSDLQGYAQPVVIQAYKTTVKEFEGKYFRFTRLSVFNSTIWVKKE